MIWITYHQNDSCRRKENKEPSVKTANSMYHHSMRIKRTTQKRQQPAPHVQQQKKEDCKKCQCAACLRHADNPACTQHLRNYTVQGHAACTLMHALRLTTTRNHVTSEWKDVHNMCTHTHPDVKNKNTMRRGEKFRLQVTIDTCQRVTNIRCLTHGASTSVTVNLMHVLTAKGHRIVLGVRK